MQRRDEDEQVLRSSLGQQLPDVAVEDGGGARAGDRNQVKGGAKVLAQLSGRRNRGGGRYLGIISASIGYLLVV